MRVFTVLTSVALGALCAACSRSVVERLEHPTPVSSVGADGVHLSDGRFVGWGIGGLVPPGLTALEALTAHGVEVGSNGRAIGLVEVWHWCGNDSIHEHLARVDLGAVLEFMGGRATPGTDQPLDFADAEGQFTPRGWDVSSWWRFELWRGADPGRIWD